MLMHLSMGKGDCGFRYETGNVACHLVDVADTVIYVIYLSATGKFPVNGLPDHLVIILHHVRLDRHTVHRRFLQNTHITNSHQTHVQCPGNRSRRQRENIDIFLQLFDLLFMCHTEPLLLIDNQKPQIFKLDIL